MTIITSVEDLRALYQRRVPKMFYDYCESGSYTESTFRQNQLDFQRIHIRQRVGVDISDVQTNCRLFGADAAIPAALAPIGMLGMQHPAGEILAARAARDFGVPFTLSTMSICSIEQVAAATQQPFWFQLYVVRDRDFVRDLIERARAARCSALVITMDLPMLGQRHKDLKNQLSLRPNLKNLINILSKPRWAWGMARTPYRAFGNVIGHAKGVDDLASLIVWAAEKIDPTLNWQDVEWIQKQWGGPVILKGIMDAEDAKIAQSMGIKALVISNHGGRQLDGAGSSISLLPAIKQAVGDDIELLLDSGVRTGIDIFRACALGASGVLLGRAMVYALGALGEQGVSQMLEILQKELKTTMGLAATHRIQSITPTNVYQR